MTCTNRWKRNFGSMGGASDDTYGYRNGCKLLLCYEC